jgi:hypothetical protein
VNRKTAHNSTYPKVAVQWLNQALCFYQSFCLVDSEVLRNRHLRVAAKRYKWTKCLKQLVYIKKVVTKSLKTMDNTKMLKVVFVLKKSCN